jgi:hypothetical protein
MPVPPAPAMPPGAGSALVSTARVAGLFYLSLGVTGMLGFLVIRPALFVADDAAGTLARLVDHEPLARAGIALEMATVLAQTLAALWFYRLFRSIDTFAAGSLAVFGLFNAAAIMTSAALLATALQSALGPLSTGDGPQLFYLASANAWNVGNLFFGLWLIPMGWCVLRSGWMPKSLGWILIAGGPGYVLNAFASYLAPQAGVATALLVVPATIGEFWMIGYLLIHGIRRDAPSTR